MTEQSGQLLGLGVGSTIAGTTDTTAKEREPVRSDADGRCGIQM
ncbi:Major capsid protein precursor [Escherichia coli O25b:H4]|uniref:Major capsid protein n=1 Tax=Escherichia coli O25b:H4 TaxID=941280 RepID=A0A192CMX9_ECO25|nr:P2 family phage major capsid protein [Escherichia coli]ANK07225.1 Major capsid protein precursor [Escherichia coli O25b:H4]